MKYLGEEKQVEIKTVSERQIEYMRCDKCGKKITPYKYKEKQNQFVRIHTYHNDWGNDSIDSHEYHDYCVECAKEVVAEYISEMNGTEELELENKYLTTNASYQGYDGWEDGYELVENDKQALLDKKKEDEEKRRAIDSFIDLFPNAKDAILNLDLVASQFGIKDEQ